MTEQWVRHILSVHMADISKQFSSSACCGPGYNLARQSMVLVIMALDDPYVLINRIMAGILDIDGQKDCNSGQEQDEGLREVGLGQRNKFPSNNDSNNPEIQLQTINNSVAQPSKVKEYPLLIITWNVMKNKIKKSPAYEFGLDDKKFQVDVDVFREILGICPRVPKEDFVPPPSEEELLNFLLELGYKGPSSGLHTIKDDGVISRFKFVRIGEDFQEYGLAILETMLTEEIKHSEAYQTFIKYSTCLIPPKKS
ncbi:hypothetical protein Tco_1185708 [Tanacetum coccineum]